MYIFISHSSTDAVIAKEICHTLEAAGVQCFLAPRDIRSGYEYASELLNGLDRSDVFLLLLSNKSNQSPHVLREVERAVSNATPIIVYKLEDVELTKSMEYFLMTHQWLNAENDDYTNLLRGVQELMKSNIEKNSEISSSAATNLTVTQHNANTSLKTQPMDKSKSCILPWIATFSTIIALVIIICVLLFKDSSDNVSPAGNTTNIAQSGSITDNSQSNTDSIPTSDTTATDNDTDSSTTETIAVNNATAANVKLGDTIVMGNYNGADIEWIVINISDDNTEAVIITKNIISFKGFCGSESSEFALSDEGTHYFYNDPAVADDLEQQEYLWGSNIWENSHIRTWLNSEDEFVTYDGRGPISLTMTDHSNGYNLEAGFLRSFTDEELTSIKETTIETKGNGLSDTNTITTADRVFLLSKNELTWLTSAGIPWFTAPTSEAVNLNESMFYQEYCLDVFKTTSCPWWLRDPVEDTVSECYLVSHGAKPDRNYENAIVAVESYGIRPAMTIDLTSNCIKVK